MVGGRGVRSIGEVWIDDPRIGSSTTYMKVPLSHSALLPTSPTQTHHVLSASGLSLWNGQRATLRGGVTATTRERKERERERQRKREREKGRERAAVPDVFEVRVSVDSGQPLEVQDVDDVSYVGAQHGHRDHVLFVVVVVVQPEDPLVRAARGDAGLLLEEAALHVKGRFGWTVPGQAGRGRGLLQRAPRPRLQGARRGHRGAALAPATGLFAVIALDHPRLVALAPLHLQASVLRGLLISGPPTLRQSYFVFQGQRSRDRQEREGHQDAEDGRRLHVRSPVRGLATAGISPLPPRPRPSAGPPIASALEKNEILGPLQNANLAEVGDATSSERGWREGEGTDERELPLIAGGLPPADRPRVEERDHRHAAGPIGDLRCRARGPRVAGSRDGLCSRRLVRRIVLRAGQTESLLAEGDC